MIGEELTGTEIKYCFPCGMGWSGGEGWEWECRGWGEAGRLCIWGEKQKGVNWWLLDFAHIETACAPKLENCQWKQNNMLVEKESLFSASCLDNFSTQHEQDRVWSKTKTSILHQRLRQCGGNWAIKTDFFGFNVDSLHLHICREREAHGRGIDAEFYHKIKLHPKHQESDQRCSCFISIFGMTFLYSLSHKHPNHSTLLVSSPHSHPSSPTRTSLQVP